jgi:hypothetical protein
VEKGITTTMCSHLSAKGPIADSRGCAGGRRAGDGCGVRQGASEAQEENNEKARVSQIATLVLYVASSRLSRLPSRRCRWLCRDSCQLLGHVTISVTLLRAACPPANTAELPRGGAAAD